MYRLEEINKCNTALHYNLEAKKMLLEEEDIHDWYILGSRGLCGIDCFHCPYNNIMYDIVFEN